METTIGGDRLGSGNKMQVSYKNYERSNHDLSYIWRSTMSAGTLVPFMSKLALPGDIFEIDLDCDVMTHPTIGPLFGSFKVQLDIFEIPMRLYNAKLHMNKLGVGMDMSNIFLPQISLSTNNHASYVQTHDDNEQINSSCLLKYLGISGLGHITGETNPAQREFNAIPLLAYWDIYKNYYSNKQEEIGYYIGIDSSEITASMTPTHCTLLDGDWGYIGDLYNNALVVYMNNRVIIKYPSNCTEPEISTINVHINDEAKLFTDLCENIVWNNNYKQLSGDIKDGNHGLECYINSGPHDPKNNQFNIIALKSFTLDAIDNMRETILSNALEEPFVITGQNDAPYNAFHETYLTNENLKYSLQYSQCGLGIKTYQSDLFNNWINTEWIEGENGVSALTAIDTSGGEFTIDALNIAQKVYVMLNRIAISGGTYDDWLDAVYTHERTKGVESPVYCGGLIKELAFQEVINNSPTDEQPLGTLAGRGQLTNKHKGGKVIVKANEPSYILGIVSLTPRIEYSQGNDSDVNLKSYDDFHKPALDGIGFQDLITEQLLWSDTTLNSADSTITQNALGKQPAWINYMTSINKVYGNFANESEMFMVLNRRYEKDTDGSILDATTYIDPTKFNHIFADTSLDSQNFWVQISANIQARRKMSAKLIPNL